MIQGEANINRVGDRAAADGRVDRLHMPVVVQRHGADAVTTFYTQFRQCVGQPAGAGMPLTPGEPQVVALIIAVDHGDIIRIHVQRSLHEVFNQQGIMLVEFRVGRLFGRH